MHVTTLIRPALPFRLSMPGLFIFFGVLVATVHAEPESDPQVTLADFPATHVAYLEHTGPYWTVGRELARVHDEMVRLGATGPLFARYLDDHVAESPASRRIQLGFVMTSADAAPKTFQRADWPATTAAVLALPRPPASLSRTSAVLRQWSGERGYAPSGPLVEVYLQNDGDWMGSPVELRLPVRLLPLPPQPPKESTVPAPGLPPPVAPDPISSGISRGISEDRQKPVVTRTIELRPRRTSSPPSDSPTSSEWDSKENPEKVPVPSPVNPLPTNPEGEFKNQLAGTAFGPKLAKPEPSDPPAPPRMVTPTSPTPAPARTVQELMSSGQISELATRLMPTSPALPAPVRLWLGEMVGRIDAANRGMGSLYPNSVHAATALAEGLNKHYDGWATDAEKAARLRPTTPIGMNRETPLAARVLIRDMDILLARLSQRALTPEAVQTQLEILLQRSIDFVESGKMAAPPNGSTTLH